MNINEEKAYIFSMMRDISAERRKLTDIYYSLHERMNELNKLEEHGLSDLNLRGYVDLHNESNKRIAANNLNRELAAAAAAQQAPPVIPAPFTHSPAAVVAEVRQEIAQKPQDAPEPAPVVSSPSVSIPFEEMDRMKQIDAANKIKPAADRMRPRERRRSKIKQEKAARAIVEILKDLGTPVTSTEIYHMFLAKTGLSDEEVTIKSFRSNLLYRTVQENPNIITQDIEGERAKSYVYME